jgi:hypothetical protein
MQDRRQQRGRRGGQALLRGGERQIATGLVMQRQRELPVMGPRKQPLQREVDDDRDELADRQRAPEGHPDDVSEQPGGAHVSDGNGAPAMAKRTPCTSAPESGVNSVCCTRLRAQALGPR